MIRIRILTALACASIAIPAFTLSAQNQTPPGPPQHPKNLKVLPKDIPMEALLDTMGTFTRALGVNCAFCHVADESLPRDKHDMASDIKPNKDKARTMLRMVMAINADYLTKLSSRGEPPVVVTCATCHRGLAEPRQIQQVVLTTYDAAGADSAMALYRGLRQQYYGRASYDFGDVPLADVGGALRQRNKTADALKFYMLNLEFSPNSAAAWRQAGSAQLASGDTATAVKSLQKALSLNPNDRQTTRILDGLKPKQ